MLEQVMIDFYEGRFDILLCTSLIENGLDQPNANTMIVYDADRLGLSQIYQMRGRVGRSARIAYAYFLYRPEKILTQTAEKRLLAIREFTELGSGFKIALRDLEIRGAGNLLGAEQSGNLAGVGFNTYCTMLDEAIRRLQGGEAPAPEVPALIFDLAVDAYLPDEYLADETQKIEIYQRLLALQNEQELTELTDEIIDRFGSPPKAAEYLLKVVSLRILAKKMGIGSIVESKKELLITWLRTDVMPMLNITQLPNEIMQYLHFLPSAPPRVKIDKIKSKMNTLTLLRKVLTSFSMNSDND